MTDDYLDHLEACLGHMATDLQQVRQGKMDHEAMWDAMSIQVSRMAQLITDAGDDEDDDEGDDDEVQDDPFVEPDAP